MEDLRNYINSLRRDFMQKELSEASLQKNPFEQFSTWMEEAVNAQILDPHAMILATADKQAAPSVRTVFLRDISEHGFVFYTNYKSRKAQEIEANNRVSVLFLWEEVERQVRIEGYAEKVSAAMSDAYFAGRPRDSQLGAWASNQSAELASSEALMEKYKEAEMRFEGKPVERPPCWGGYMIKPDYFEFWQGRPNRLHDRFAYKMKSDVWHISRLNP